MKTRNQLLTTATRFTAALLFAATANAQHGTSATATAETGADADNTGIAEIIVTAERRATDASKTPVSLEAISGAELVTRGIQDITALAENDSSLNVSYSSSYPILSIRGISSEDVTEAGDPAISVAVDGIFNNRPFGLFGGLYDVDHVEILRGPQGTLFGRNSTGGTVNVLTAKPTDTTDGEVTAEVGNYGLVNVQGYANFAVSDTVQVRLSILATQHQGYRYIPPTGQKGDDSNVQSGRLQVAFEPTENLHGSIFFQYTGVNDVGPVAQQIPFSYIPGSPDGEPVHSLPVGSINGSGFPLYADYGQILHNYDLHGTLNYTFSGGQTLTYLGGYNYADYDVHQVITTNNYGPAYAQAPFQYYNNQHPTTYNQELRLASAANNTFTWQVGAYYFAEYSHLLAGVVSYPGTAQESDITVFRFPQIDSHSKALYGQAGYQITDKLKFSGGLRYTKDDKDREDSFFSVNVAFPNGTFLITPNDNGSAESSKVTWSTDLSYEVTPQNFAYAKVATGYKAGGYNSATSQFLPETVISYEIGSKNKMLNNHVEFNIDGFLMNYTDQQISQFVNDQSSGGLQTDNAGKTRIYGIESNLIFQDNMLGRLDFSATYLHARYLSFTEGKGWVSSFGPPDPNPDLNLAGYTPPLSPTISATAQYQRPVTLSSGATITPRISAKYQSTVYFAPTNYADETQGGYAVVDLGIGYQPASQRWTLQSYVKNVANRTILNDAQETYLFNHVELGYAPPRTYGVRFTAHF